jgi:hypothetical protein
VRGLTRATWFCRDFKNNHLTGSIVSDVFSSLTKIQYL